MSGTARPCRGYHRNEDPPISSDPLCEGCTERVRRAINELPELYLALYLDLEPGTGASGPRTSGTKERPLPIATGPHELMIRIYEAVAGTCEVLRHAAGLSDPQVPGSLSERSAGGWALSTACRTLEAHLERLLTLPPTSVMRSLPETEAVDAEVVRTMEGGAWYVLDMDGAQAAVELSDLAHQARNMLGHTRGLDRLSMHCPDIDCNAAGSLVRWHGNDQVDCEACGRAWPRDEFDRLRELLRTYDQKAM